MSSQFTKTIALIALEECTGRNVFENADEQRKWEMRALWAADNLSDRLDDDCEHIDLREFMRAALKQDKLKPFRHHRKILMDALANREAIELFYAQAHRLSSIFEFPFAVDHIVPIAKGGKHHETNLQVIPKRLNSQKHARILENPVWRYPDFSVSC